MSPTAFAQTPAQHAADVGSWAAVIASVTADTKASYEAPNRWRAVGWQAARYSCAIGLSLLAKRVVRRERPDGSGDDSFWSAHTALAAASAFPRGWTIGLSVTTAVGGLRLAAHKHYPTDVEAGALAGLGCSFLR